MEGHEHFKHWFRQATGHEPYPFQIRFAFDQGLLPYRSHLQGEDKGEGIWNRAGLLVNIPTGLGKTAMAVLGWLWRRERDRLDIPYLRMRLGSDAGA